MQQILILIFVFLFPTFSILLSQEPPQPVIWEEVSEEDLRMSSYQPDEDAEALILCDYGKTELNNDFNLVFSRHLRIKIFNKNGFEWGTQSIVVYTHKGFEYIDDIEGITYTLDDDGEIQSKELDSDDIFEEDLDDKREKTTFTMPGLEPGCIIDIKYQIISTSLYFIKDWTFQHEIPIRWSEYRVEIPKNIVYVGVHRGFVPWEVNETLETRKFVSGVTKSYIGNEQPKMNLSIWAIKDAPALKDVPYITTIDDYTNKVELQLNGYSLVRNRKVNILGTWEKLVDELVDESKFYDRIDVTGDVEDLVKQIIKGVNSKKQQMIEIYNWVKNSIVWDGKNRVYAQFDVDEVLEYRKGSSSEVNFLLLSMLKCADIQGNPVILSTRSHGRIQKLYPILNQFNYTMSQVIVDGKKYYLDATDPLRPYDLLPSKILSVIGLVIKPDNEKVEWITLSCKKRNISNTHVVASVNELGEINGTINESFSEYRSLSFRRDLEDEEQKEFAEDLYDSEEFGLELDSILISTKDSIHLPLKMATKFRASNYAQLNGDYIYINPLIVHRRENNPFKLKERYFHVDFNYRRSYNSVINLTIPEGYEVLEKLEDKAIRLAKNLKFKRIMNLNGNTAQILYRYDISKPIVDVREYQALKEFYSMIIDLQAEQLVLRKKNESDVKNNESKG